MGKNILVVSLIKKILPKLQSFILFFMAKVIPIILSGGVGSRLWPVSRTKRPKPFMWVQGEGNLLNRTLNRLQGLDVSDIMSVSNLITDFFVERYRQ